MKILTTGILFAALAGTAGTHASASASLEKLKTGIHPSGGFYTIYAATCPDRSSANIASVGRHGRWCVTSEGELSCFRRSQEALSAACVSRELVALEEDPGDVEEY